MPHGDGTGPLGQGARTGRGLGFCNGFDAPGFARGTGCHRGRGWGRHPGRRGRGGQGWGRLALSHTWTEAPPPPMPPTARPVAPASVRDEIATLHARLDGLQQQMAELTRLLKKQGDEPAATTHPEGAPSGSPQA